MNKHELPSWTIDTKFEEISPEVFLTFIWKRIMQNFYVEFNEKVDPCNSNHTLLSSDNLNKENLLAIIKDFCEFLEDFVNFYTCIKDTSKIIISKNNKNKLKTPSLKTMVGYRVLWLTDLESDGSVEQEKLCLKRYSIELEEDWKIGIFSIPGFRDKNYSLLTALDLNGIDRYICPFKVFD